MGEEMKFACSRCWDRDCYCTEEELAEHDAKTKANGISRRTDEASNLLQEYYIYLETRTCYADMVSLSSFLSRKER